MFILRTFYSQKNKPGSICRELLLGIGIRKKILGYKVGGDVTMSSAVTQVKPIILHFFAQQKNSFQPWRM